MEIKSKLVREIELTEQDVEIIIKDYLKNKFNIDTAIINFIIKAEYDPSDWQGKYGPDYVFGGVKCTQQEIT